jgi:hypothetical protein
MKKHIGLIVLCSIAITSDSSCMNKKKNSDNFVQKKIAIKLPNAVIKVLREHGAHIELLKKNGFDPNNPFAPKRTNI